MIFINLVPTSQETVSLSYKDQSVTTVQRSEVTLLWQSDENQINFGEKTYILYVKWLNIFSIIVLSCICERITHSLFLVCETIGTVAIPGLLCQPRVTVKMIVEKQMECRLEGETKVLRENLPQRHFCPSQNPKWPDPGLNPGRRGGKPATNFIF
jgi:hypothetical protein